MKEIIETSKMITEYKLSGDYLLAKVWQMRLTYLINKKLTK
mgnify:CR=1 FL=1|tara:strand:+ start:680 stop:802 length:123 start_codon:yes stop_codon:yes gene_type:complete